MIVGVEDGLGWVGFGQVLGIGLTVNVVFSATVDGEVGRFVDKCSGLGVGTGVGGAPEGTAEVDRPEFVRVWSGGVSVIEYQFHD